MPDLKTTIDQIGFELISKHHPQIIADVNQMLGSGVTAKQIERRLRRYSASITANLTVCAAYYLETQRKTQTSEVSQ